MLDAASLLRYFVSADFLREIKHILLTIVITKDYNKLPKKLAYTK